MSREIKFRAWDKDSVKYVDGVGELYVDILEIGTKTFRIEQMCPGRYIIEQYTGLNDKNGKEIYEGDIIQEFIDTGDENETRTYRYEVYWDEDTLCWSIKGYHDYDYNLHCDLWETNASREVIGNTHEGVKDESK